MVRSSENCTLEFTAYLKGESKSTKTLNLKKGVATSVDLFFENPVHCNSQTEFYIEINENEKEDKTAFQFDSLVIFLKE